MDAADCCGRHSAAMPSRSFGARPSRCCWFALRRTAQRNWPREASHGVARSAAANFIDARSRAMDLNEAILGRRAVREYTQQAIDTAVIRRLIDAAIFAPSAVNAQPWTFTVVRDQALLDRISDRAKSHMLATLAPGAQADHFHSMLSDAKFQIFYHAPVLVLISALTQARWIVEDCALAAENLM